MKIRINGSWVDTSLYIRDGGVWKYIGNPSSANEIVVYITSTTTNVNVSSFFGPYWTQNIAKKLIINSGVTVGATSTNNYALNVSSGLIGILRVDNYGSIQGAGGLPNGGTGGNAILANSSVSINNQGTIYAGGGGGGQGGFGGTGGQGAYTASYIQCGGGTGTYCDVSTYDEACQRVYGESAYCDGGQYNNDYSQCYTDQNGYTQCFYPCGKYIYPAGCSNCCYTAFYTAYSSGGAGGVGGNGGVGQGYNQSPTSGSPGFGGSAGGINAGTGGFGAFGGAGGGWGASGGAGSTGGTGANGNYTVGSVGSAGSPGGLPGFYVVNNGNISWINTGSVLGRVV